eukprot:m.49943 g.49943  ORF g.49943 m.49943 type:complete len:371 (-) comp21166_c0_seq1:5-1117(-)
MTTTSEPVSIPKLTPLALGTVQLGLPYGAANTTGMPSEADAIEIVRFAALNGIESLDTAHAYELSQERVGKAMASLRKDGLPQPVVITKLDPSIETCGTAAEVESIVDESVAHSIARLSYNPLPVCLLHRWDVHGPTLHSGAAWKRLKYHKKNNTITRIGSSTYGPAEVTELLADEDTDHLQAPVNILDWRWEDAGIEALCAKRKDVTVHARSCFLQGILVSSPDRWPAKFGRELAQEYVDKLEQLVKLCNRRNRVDLCMAYVRALPWVTEVVCGAETLDQLKELVDLVKTDPLTPEQVALVRKTLPRAPIDLLNPGKWHDKPSYAGSFNTGLLVADDDADTKETKGINNNDNNNQDNNIDTSTKQQQHQ